MTTQLAITSGRFSHKTRLAVATLIAATIGIIGVAAPASAIWWVKAPPTCHNDSRWISFKQDGRQYVLAYNYAFRHTTRSASSQGVVYRTYYTYDVQNVMYPYGLVTVGRAQKLCGTWYS